MRKVFPQLGNFLRASYSFLQQMQALIAVKPNISEHSACFVKPHEVVQDLEHIQAFLNSGIRSTSLFIRTMTMGSEAIQVVVHVDWASNPHTIGGVCLTSGEWFRYTPCPEFVTAASASGFPSSPVFEAAALPIALYTFRSTVRGKMVLFCSDSDSFVKAYHNMKSSSRLLEELSKLITLCELRLECKIILTYIPRTANIADPITHNQVENFRRIAGQNGFCPRPSPNVNLLPPFPTCLSGSSPS